jgi:DHA1 family multidrug resistance protein-like MFS transporter
METWRRSFSALWFAELIAIMGFATSNPIIPLYLTELGITDQASLNWWTGAVSASSSLMLAIFAPIWGSLADSYGRKLMLLRAMIGGSILMGAMAFTTAPWQILVLKTLQGCFTGTVAAATVLTTSIVPAEEIGYRLGLMQMAVFVGNSLGPLLGGFVTDVAGSRVNFIMTGVLLGGAAFVSMRTIKEDFVPKSTGGSLLRKAMPDFGILARKPALIPLMLTIFGVQFANSIVGQLMPLIVLAMRGGRAATGSVSGLIIGIASASGALGSVAVGRLSRRWGYRRSLVWCIFGAFLFYIPQGLANAPWQLMVLRALSGFFMGGTMPTVNALIAQIGESDRRGATYGLSSSVSSGGMALGPAAGAALATAAGYPAVFFTTCGLLGIIGVWVAASARRSEAAADALQEGPSRLQGSEDGGQE